MAPASVHLLWCNCYLETIHAEDHILGPYLLICCWRLSRLQSWLLANVTDACIKAYADGIEWSPLAGNLRYAENDEIMRIKTSVLARRLNLDRTLAFMRRARVGTFTKLVLSRF